MSNSKNKHLLAAAFFLLLVPPIAGKNEDATQDAGIGTCEECVAATDSNSLQRTLTSRYDMNYRDRVDY